MNPYVGITDFMRIGQVESMLAVFNEHLPKGSERKLHVGVMTSQKVLTGAETRWSKAFPLKEDIADIFGNASAYNCLHYVDYEPEFDWWKDLVRAISYGGLGMHALQLDMVWPFAGHIKSAVSFSGKKLEVILQLGRNALDETKNDPAEVVQRLKDYEGVIHRVLLDRSMGKGVPMDSSELLPFARAIRESFPELGLVVAGGLGPDSIHPIKPILKEFPDISIDAQSRLRPSGDAMYPVDWDMASKYIMRALEILR